ncbi:DUF7793 family protein [Arthrobacter sp. TMN-37]
MTDKTMLHDAAGMLDAGGGGEALRLKEQTKSTDGITVITLPAGEHISRRLAEHKAEEARQLAAGVPRPLLIDIRGVKSIDRNARAILGAAQMSAAVALLGTSPVDRVLGNFVVGGQQPRCPVAFFTSRREAVAWLVPFRPVP